MPSQLDSFYSSVSLQVAPGTFPTLDKLSSSLDKLEAKTRSFQKAGVDAFTLRAAKAPEALSFRATDRAHKALDLYLNESGRAMTKSLRDKEHFKLDERIDFLRKNALNIDLAQAGEKHQKEDDKLLKRKEKLQKDKDKYLKNDGNLFSKRREFWTRILTSRGLLYAFSGGLGLGASALLLGMLGGLQRTAGEGFTAGNIGLDPRELHRISGAFSLYNVPKEQTAAMLSNFLDLAAQAELGIGKGFSVFSRYGIRPYDPKTRKLLSPEALLTQVFNATAGLKNPLLRQQALSEFGIGPQFYQPLQKGIYGLERRANVNFGVTNQDYLAAEKFNVAWNQTKNELSDISTLLEVKFLPVLNTINSILQAFLAPTPKDVAKKISAYNKQSILYGPDETSLGKMFSIENQTINMTVAGDPKAIKEALDIQNQKTAQQLHSYAKNNG